jgi:hypothetical protein
MSGFDAVSLFTMPLHLQALWMQQWLGLAAQGARVLNELGRQSFQAWQTTLTASQGAVPWGAPFGQFAHWPMAGGGATFPFTAMAPTFAAWPNTGLPFGFPMSAVPPPWAGWMGLWPGQMFAMAMTPMLSPRSQLAMADLAEQTAQAYRSASGYAVATVLAPFSGPIRSDAAVPMTWWPFGLGR